MDYVKNIKRKALHLTNMAYLLADMANTCVVDADGKLRLLDTCFRQDEKRRYKRAQKIIKDAIKATNEITEPFYQLKDLENACCNSDYLLEALKLIINRTDETEESKTAMLEHIKKLPQVEHVEV